MNKKEEQVEKEVFAWWDKFFENPPEITQEQAEDFVKFLYETGDLPPPKEVFLVESPEQAQQLAKKLLVERTGEKNPGWQSHAGIIYDFGWVIVCEAHWKNGKFKNEKYETYLSHLKNGPFDLISYKDVAIVMKFPHIYYNQAHRLHREDGPAVEFKDGTKAWLWNGVVFNDPLMWTNPDAIDRDYILKEKNAERRRGIQEKLGAERFAEVLGTIVVDEDIDHNGKPMRLLKTAEKDEIAEDHIFFADVICPSTDRRYFLTVPPTVSNVWDAVAFTFGTTKEGYKVKNHT